MRESEGLKIRGRWCGESAIRDGYHRDTTVGREDDGTTVENWGCLGRVGVGTQGANCCSIGSDDSAGSASE